jgi:hypothetical protein
MYAVRPSIIQVDMEYQNTKPTYVASSSSFSCRPYYHRPSWTSDPLHHPLKTRRGNRNQFALKNSTHFKPAPVEDRIGIVLPEQ